MNKTRLNCLDGIKGLSALGIACVYHLATINFPYKSGLPLQGNFVVNWFYTYGYLLVELFLMISGILTFGCYSQRINEGMSFAEFAKKRVVRIFPLMWVTLAMSVTLSILFYLSHEHTFFWGGE